MDSCNHVNKQNCLRNYQCPDGYECCSEKNNPANAKPTYGHCVQKSTCDYSRGLCTGKNQELPNVTTERFAVFSEERYGDNSDCSKKIRGWKYAFWVVLGICVLLILVMVLRRSYSMSS